MKIYIKLPPKFVFLMIAILLLPACSDSILTAGEKNLGYQGISGDGVTMTKGDLPESDTISVRDNQSSENGMVGFDGMIFVALTEPIPNRWELAGWKIGRESQATDENQVPPDCTLYPHLGVEEQWIGSCFGFTYVPKDGASHIAVMYTNPEGNTTLVQVAPQPDFEAP